MQSLANDLLHRRALRFHWRAILFWRPFAGINSGPLSTRLENHSLTQGLILDTLQIRLFGVERKTERNPKRRKIEKASDPSGSESGTQRVYLESP